MKFYANGVLLQQTNFPDKTLHDLSSKGMFRYEGLNAYMDIPLSRYSSDTEARCLQNEYMDRIYKIDSDGNLTTKTDLFYSLPFLNRYLRKCKELNIPVRTLFVESELMEPLWDFPLPTLRFMGYEYCSSPLDEQIITDLFFHPPLAHYIPKLNSYGLFDKLEDCEAFKRDYDNAFASGAIGDGEASNYIFRLSFCDF